MRTIFHLVLAWFLVIEGTFLIVSTAVPALTFDLAFDPSTLPPAQTLLRQTLPLLLLGLVGVFTGVHLRQLQIRAPRPLARRTSWA